MAAGNKNLRQDLLLFVAFSCFFFSGAAGLIYEVVWTRMLTQIFGNTTYAIATVLSAFMAGLALGILSFGRLADRGKNNFLLYGFLEAGVGAFAGGFIFIPVIGVQNTIIVAVVINLLVGWFLVVVDTHWIGNGFYDRRHSHPFAGPLCAHERCYDL